MKVTRNCKTILMFLTSSLSVGIKDISYPFEAFLEDYAKDGHVSDYNLNNAKDVSLRILF